MRAVFREIVTDVCERYEYCTDREQYGKAEYWTELNEVDGLLLGDCEDYCLTIANRAIEAGIPSADLRLHLVATDRQPNHIILDYDGWFADSNKQGIVRRPPYRFISHRQLDQRQWHTTRETDL